MTSEATPERSQDLHWLPSGGRRGYIRFVALGDSATCGFGDTDPSGMRRGWARLLADAIAQDHDLSFCNLAVAGSTIGDVRRDQLGDALDHGAHLASLIVGLNDTMRSAWNPTVVRADLLHCAQRLSEQGALLLTVRFHDHARVFHLRGPLGRPLQARIAFLDQVYDEIHERYGGLRVDLAVQPGIYDREFWSVDRLHPPSSGTGPLSPRVHQPPSRRRAALGPPGLELDGTFTGTWHNLHWMICLRASPGSAAAPAIWPPRPPAAGSSRPRASLRALTPHGRWMIGVCGPRS